MFKTNRRTAIQLLGGAALTIASLPVVSIPAIAQEDPTVPNSLQNFKRGTIHSTHPDRRSFVIIWQDMGRVKMKAADLVTNFGSLKPGQIVDTHWYTYMDFLIAKKTAETSARAKAMVAQGARLITGPDYRWVLAYSMVLAPILLIGSDVIGRVVARPGELQVGIVTAVIGAPFFVLLVRRRRLAEL